jgi:hypothetical protein
MLPGTLAASAEPGEMLQRPVGDHPEQEAHHRMRTEIPHALYLSILEMNPKTNISATIKISRYKTEGVHPPPPPTDPGAWKIPLDVFGMFPPSPETPALVPDPRQ